jgi:hypothetical protein
MDDDTWNAIAGAAPSRRPNVHQPPEPTVEQQRHELETLAAGLRAQGVAYGMPAAGAESIRVTLHAWSPDTVQALGVVADGADGSWCMSVWEWHRSALGDPAYCRNVVGSTIGHMAIARAGLLAAVRAVVAMPGAADVLAAGEELAVDARGDAAAPVTCRVLEQPGSATLVILACGRYELQPLDLLQAEVVPFLGVAGDAAP